jgi:AbrB family looped-hinge helix DNA binding protein|nr:MAG TPA: stage V sporulation protein T [Caudoviricetes sp.]
MITTGIVRRFDDLGRIHIPKEIRKKVFGKYNVEGTPMEFFYDKDGNIIIKLYKESNVNE